MVNAWRHESFFFYNVTRPYPFRWFTPTVVGATVVLMVVFTLINLITQGFEIVTVASSNPTNLLSRWEQSLPNFLTKKTRPTCAPVQITVGSTLYSNQKGLAYKLDAVDQKVLDSPWVVQSALTYTDDPIKNCTVTALSISLNGKSRSPQERAWMEWGPQARAFVRCEIPVLQDPVFPTTMNAPSQVVRVNLTTTYDYVSDDIAYGPWRVSNQDLRNNPSRDGLTSLIVEDVTESSASLFWAASMLSMYWAQTSARMTNETKRIASSGNSNNAQLSSGIVYFRRNNNINDIKDLGFFDIDYRMFFDQANGDMDISFANSSDTVSSLANSNRSPNIWIPADSLAKSLWSTIMADLGDNLQTQVIVKDEELTRHFTSNFTQILSELNNTRYASARPGPITEPYATAGSRTPPLEKDFRSTIDTTFLCQQPQWKNPGEIFILVLAQNLVFLGTVWRAWTLLVGWLFLRQDRLGRDINYCEGHIDDHRARSTGVLEQPAGAPEGLSRRWRRQDEGAYNESGLGYRAVAVAETASPPPPVSRFSRDYKTLPQVAESEK